jgi:hypothetical protein
MIDDFTLFLQAEGEWMDTWCPVFVGLSLLGFKARARAKVRVKVKVRVRVRVTLVSILCLGLGLGKSEFQVQSNSAQMPKFRVRVWSRAQSVSSSFIIPLYQCSC